MNKQPYQWLTWGATGRKKDRLRGRRKKKKKENEMDRGEGME
jgi:hypothetical protein